MATGKIHIGTSGWSYRHWRGIFYPPGMPSRSWLAFYSQQFGVAEINSSFYRLPSLETISNWVSQTPKGFRFCPKISRYITHMKKLHDPKDILPRFFQVFEPVKKWLGPILIHHPESFPFHE